MGEAKRTKSATAKLLQQFPHCCFCGGIEQATTREHIPPKALFDNSHRPDGLVVPACIECNGGSSTADLIVSLMARWRFDVETAQERKDHRRLAMRLHKQAPDIAAEWTTLGLIQRKKARRHLIEQGLQLPGRGSIVAIGQVTIPHIRLFSHKLTLGLYFDHFRKPVTAKGGVFATFWTKEDLALHDIPKEMLAYFPKARTLVQGVWNTADQFTYRYDFNEREDLFGCVAKLRTGLFVIGLALGDLSVLPPDEQEGFLAPECLSKLLRHPNFTKRF